MLTYASAKTATSISVFDIVRSHTYGVFLAFILTSIREG